MNESYKDLDRRFNTVTEDQLKNPDALTFHSDWFGGRSSTSWLDLEKRFRTVIIAEAGSGKTEEMKERRESLRGEGKFAFFIPLEALALDSVDLSLEHDELPSLKEWLQHSTAQAWFYLDAVDELKLTGGIFKRALNKFRQAIHGGEMRARIIVSCRPSDWHMFDVLSFKRILPPPAVIIQEDEEPESIGEAGTQSSEERFLAPLRGKPSLTKGGERPSTARSSLDQSEREKFVIYRLEPLRESQIEQFVRETDGNDPDGLISEIGVKDAWDFARRPQDLIELIALWQERGSLGSLTQQHEANIRAKLKDRSDRPGQDQQLSYKNALDGAEKLALALVLSKTLTIRILDQNSRLTENLGSIDAENVLYDWKKSDVNALLSLGIFDPASFSRIRFHHRSVQEYLAARRFHKLSMQGNASKLYLLQRFFTEISSGELVMIPSMRAIAVWLAQWNPDVRKRILDFEPELLISSADPEQLPPEDRSRILRATVKKYLSTDTGSLPYSPEMLRRFAFPELGVTVRDLWEESLGDKELTGFLLSLIKEGRIGSCCDLAEAAARSFEVDDLDRVVAVLALISCGEDDKVQALAEEIAADPSNWNSRFVRTIAADLFPRFLSARKFVRLIELLGESRGDWSFNFHHSLTTIVNGVDPQSPEARELRESLAKLICDNQQSGSAHYYPTSMFSFVTPELTTLCLLQAPTVNADEREEFLNCCIVANHFRPDQHTDNKSLQELRDFFKGGSYSSEELFVAEFDFVSRTFKMDRSGIQVSQQHSFMRDCSVEDKVWLSRLIIGTSNSDFALAAFLEILRVWKSAGSPDDGLEELREIAQDKEEIESLLNSWLKSDEPHPSEKEWEAQKLERKLKEAERIDGWKEWRDKFISNPEFYFEEDELGRTRGSLLQWMIADNSSSSSTHQDWNGQALEEAFGLEVRTMAQGAFSSYWRGVEYKTFSEREGDDSSMPYAWVYGLNGVLAEIEVGEWASGFTTEDVRQAARLALVEINGFPPYLNELVGFTQTSSLKF